MHEVVRYIRVMTEELLDNDSGSHFLALGMSGAPAPEGFAGARDSIKKSFLRFMLPLCLAGIDNDLQQN